PRSILPKFHVLEDLKFLSNPNARPPTFIVPPSFGFPRHFHVLEDLKLRLIFTSPFRLLRSLCVLSKGFTQPGTYDPRHTRGNWQDVHLSTDVVGGKRGEQYSVEDQRRREKDLVELLQTYAASNPTTEIKHGYQVVAGIPKAMFKDKRGVPFKVLHINGQHRNEAGIQIKLEMPYMDVGQTCVFFSAAILRDLPAIRYLSESTNNVAIVNVVAADLIASKVWLIYNHKGQLQPIDFRAYRDAQGAASKTMSKDLSKLFAVFKNEELRAVAAQVLRESILYGLHMANQVSAWTGVVGSNGGASNYAYFMKFHSHKWKMVEEAFIEGRARISLANTRLKDFLSGLHLLAEEEDDGRWTLQIKTKKELNLAFDAAGTRLGWREAALTPFVALSGQYFWDLISAVEDWRPLVYEHELGEYRIALFAPEQATHWFRDFGLVLPVNCILFAAINEMNPGHAKWRKGGGNQRMSFEDQVEEARGKGFEIEVSKRILGPKKTRVERAKVCGVGLDFIQLSAYSDLPPIQKMIELIFPFEPRFQRPVMQVGLAYTLRSGDCQLAIEIPAIPKEFLVGKLGMVSFALMKLVVDDDDVAERAAQKIKDRPAPKQIAFPVGPATLGDLSTAKNNAGPQKKRRAGILPKIDNIDTMDLVSDLSPREERIHSGLVGRASGSGPHPGEIRPLAGFFDSLALL
ncbi:hypothetical protein P7C70_g8915, partial [Phenoliferia sp. Uapishka_3]